MYGKPFKHNFCNSFSVALYYAQYNGCVQYCWIHLENMFVNMNI